MSTFGGLILTNRGRNLQSKAQAGVQLQYTRIGVGDGNLGSTSILALNNLINEVRSLDIIKLKTLGNGKAVIGAVLSNQDITEGFYFREIGLFATDPDVGEILYCYGNAGDLAEYVSPGGGPDIVEKSIDVQTVIGNAQNVSAVIDESLVYATVEYVQNEVVAHDTDAEAHADIREKIQVKADLVDGKIPSEQLPQMNYLTPSDDTKSNTVTFTEAAADADIASGDTHSTLFGKILKNLNTLRESIYNIVNGGTTVGKAVTLNGLLSTIAELNFVKGVTSAIQTQLNGKASTSHANAGSTYGLGSPTLYGHVKTINALTQESHADGTALSAYQGKVLNDKIINPQYIIQTFNASGNFTVPAGVHEIDVILISGGGAGRKSAAAAMGGAGGATGGMSKYRILVEPGQVLPVVVGAGGVDNNLTDNNNSAVGGSSSVGEYASAGFGVKGGATNNGTAANPGSNHTYNIKGNFSIIAGSGGSSGWYDLTQGALGGTGGGKGGNNGQPGGNATGIACGGGGGAYGQVGGLGYRGVVYIGYYVKS